MKIERSQERDITIVALEGVIKLGESAQLFSAYLLDLLEEGVPAVLIDLSKIDHVDSTGLGELVGYLQRFTAQGRRLALLKPHERIMNLLKLTRLNDVFPIYDDKDEAVEALAEH
ncbi:MAG: STAS domain-containing protein [bacterium]|nr:STAS domain-containing protein [bacterium]